MDTDNSEARTLARRLIEQIRRYHRVVVAMSGGVDSGVVAKAASEALGHDARAVTAVSPSVSQRDRMAASECARAIGIAHEFHPVREIENPAYRANDGSRCYHCKNELYGRLTELARDWSARGDEAVLLSGANADDLGDYRPGLKAAEEWGVRHPLVELDLGKSDVRRLARYWRLPNADRPASPCLASRFAIGVEVTADRLARVEAAEAFLHEQGFDVFRVRYLADDHARVELPPDRIAEAVEPVFRESMVRVLKSLGFRFVSLDLEGFRSGSLNPVVTPISFASAE